MQEGNLPSAMLFCGEEEYTKESALAALRAKYLPEGLEALNENLLGAASTADEIVDTCEMLPFMAMRRIVLVRESGLLGKGDKGDDARLLSYIQAIPDHVLLVFYVRGPADKTRKLYKRMEAQQAIVEFSPLDERDMRIFLGREFKVANKTIAQEAQQELVARAGPLLTPISAEIKKLVAYLGERERVELEDVENVVALSSEASIFQMLEMLLRGDLQPGLVALSALLKAKEAEPAQVLALATSSLRSLYQIKLLQTKGFSDGEIGREMEEPSWRLRKNLQLSRRFTLARLKELLSLCADLDYRFKSGKVSDSGAMDILVGEMMRAR